MVLLLVLELGPWSWGCCVVSLSKRLGRSLALHPLHCRFLHCLLLDPPALRPIHPLHSRNAAQSTKTNDAFRPVARADVSLLLAFLMLDAASQSIGQRPPSLRGLFVQCSFRHAASDPRTRRSSSHVLCPRPALREAPQDKKQ